MGKMGSGLERRSWAGGDMLEGVRKRLFEVQKKSQPKHLDKEPKCPDIERRQDLSNYGSKLFSEVVLAN